MKMSASLESDRVLRSIETGIITCLDSADKVFAELCKEDDADEKQIEDHTQIFLKTLVDIETKLTDQTIYWTQASTGQPPEGSEEELTWRRIKHATGRIEELNFIRARHFRGNAPPRSISELVAESDSKIPANSAT